MRNSIIVCVLKQTTAAGRISANAPTRRDTTAAVKTLLENYLQPFAHHLCRFALNITTITLPSF